MTRKNQTDELVAQEGKNRKVLGRLEILIGMLFAIGVVAALSSAIRVKSNLYTWIVVFPFALLMSVCGVGVLSHKRPIWPLRLNRIVGFATIAFGVAGCIRWMVAPGNLLNRFIGYPPDKQESATKTVLEQAELICSDVTT